MPDNGINYRRAMDLIHLSAENLKLAGQFLELAETIARIKRHVGWATEDISDLYKTLADELKEI